MKKIILAVVTFLATIYINCAYAAEIIPNEVKVDNKKKKITVSGSYNGAKKDHITMVVYKSSECTDSDAVYAAQLTCDSEGKYSYTFGLRADDKEYEHTYYIRLGGYKVEETDIQEQTFFLMSEKRIGEILGELIEADGTEIYGIIEAYSDFLGIDLSDEGSYGRLTSEKQQQVLNMFAEEDIELINNVKTIFEKTIQKRAALDAIAASDTTEGNTFSDNIEAYKSLLDLDLTRFSLIEDKTPFDECNIHFDYVKDFEEKFYTLVDLEFINQAGWWDLEERIGLLSVDHKLQMNSVLEDVNEENHPAVFKRLADIPFTSVEDIISSLTTIASDYPFVEKPIVESNRTPSKGGGSSGGGGRRNPVAEVAPSKKVEEEHLPQLPNNEDKASVYTDIESVEWAVEAINELNKAGVLTDDGSGKFRPNDSVLREEFVKMLVIALDIPETDIKLSFNDVDPEAWYCSFISRAYDAGIVTGRNETTFGIGDSISRQDAATLVYRAVKVRNIVLAENSATENFNDLNQISDYAVDAVKYMKNTAVMNGIGDNTFAPRSNITRAMAAKIIHNIKTLMAEGAIDE